MSGRGVVPCSKCGELWLGMREPVKLARAIRDVLARAKAVAGADELDFIRVHIGLACAELEGLCVSCGWNRVAEERGSLPQVRRMRLLSLVGEAPDDVEEQSPSWMESPK